MIFDKIINNTDIKFEPNKSYLLAKPNYRYTLIITDSEGVPAFPYSENSEILVGHVATTDTGGNIENISSKVNSILSYKPHLEFKNFEDGRVMIKLSDNIINAVANSYKKISSPNPNKTFVIGIDGKPFEIVQEFLDELKIENGVLLGKKKVLKIPRDVKKIADNAFHSESLDEVLIPPTVIEIGHNSFYNNNISSITLPAFCKYYDDSFDSTVVIMGGKKEN